MVTLIAILPCWPSALDVAEMRKTIESQAQLLVAVKSAMEMLESKLVEKSIVVKTASVSDVSNATNISAARSVKETPPVITRLPFAIHDDDVTAAANGGPIALDTVVPLDNANTSVMDFGGFRWILDISMYEAGTRNDRHLHG